MRRLEGKTAIVTGAASGIGEATAKRFASEGAQVMVADMNGDGAHRVASEIVAAGGEAIAQVMDLHDEASIKTMVEVVLKKFGKLEILHNNAADMRPAYLDHDRAIEFMDTGVWDGVFHANMRGTMLATKYALPALIAAHESSIIHTSSGASLSGDLYRPAYASSKAAINTFSLYVATQYGKKGVRSNVVSPGMIMTAKLEEAIPPEDREKFTRNILGRRTGRPEDIAAVVAMLASDDGRYVNGQTIQVDGGILAHFAHVADLQETFWAEVAELAAAKQ
jgi:NAD(P)-dependent dehydrogenase (short-subunit alcohol dehydrogenase family)